jgi:hypothetical protein
MNQNFSNILYLAFRLAFSSYRFLASIDFKLGSEGVMYLVGAAARHLLGKNSPKAGHVR